MSQASIPMAAGTTIEATLPARPGRHRLVRNIAMLAGSQLATWAFTLIWTLFIPRVIGARGMGQIVTAWSTTAILNVLVGLGINVLLTKEIAVDARRAPRLLGAALLMRLAAIVPALAIMAAYLAVVHFDQRQRQIFWLATAAMLFNLVTATIQAALWGIERMEYQAFTKILSYGVVVPLSLLLVFLHYGVVALVGLELFVAVVVCALNLKWMLAYFRVEWRADLGMIRSLFVDSATYWITTIFFTTYLWVDSVMLSLLASAKVVGWYAVPTQLFSSELFVAAILSQAWFPRFAAAFAEGPERLKAIARPAVELLLVISLPIGAGAALVAPNLIGTLFGPSFAGSIPSLVILSLALPVTYLNIMGNQVVIASNRMVTWTKLMGVAAVLNPLVNLGTITFFQHRFGNGATGAAISLLLTELFQGVVALQLMRGVLDRGSLGRLARALAATLVMAVAVWLVRPFGLWAQVPIGVLTFGALAVLFGVLNADEWRELRGLLQPLRDRLPRRFR